MDGVVLIDKAEGWTSHDVVAKFRGIAKTKRVGHLGTLDPMATGVLPLAVGVATRLARFYTKAEKLYEAGVHFGFATDTYDRTGKPASEPAQIKFTPEELEAAMKPFRGVILQMPPQFSAKKVGGVVAYKAARQNIPVELQPVKIEIHELIILNFDGRHADLRVRCSGGTYIRSLAHDLGQALGCGAHLDSLRRLASGEFTVERADPLDRIQVPSALIPMAELVPQFPIFTANEIAVVQIRQGRDFTVSETSASHLRAMTEKGELIAICERAASGLYHPAVVF